MGGVAVGRHLDRAVDRRRDGVHGAGLESRGEASHVHI
jgi:hypothetical protein